MKKAAPRKPNKLVLLFLKPLIFAYFKLKYGIKVEKTAEFDKIKEPFIMVCNHGSIYDPFIVQSCIKQPLNFVGSYKYFYKKTTRKIMSILGVIPKFQYQIDIISIKQMIEVIQKKGNLCFFPTGRLPSCGEGFEATESVAKLFKICGVDVVGVKINGSYLTRPKWAKSSRKGYIFLNYDVLFSKNEIETKSIKEITTRLNGFLRFNDYEWNKLKQIKYRGKKLAEGIETTLYKCPKCGKEFNLQGKGNALCCGCGAKYELDITGMFTNSCFEHPQKWFEWQRREVAKEIKEKEVLIEDDVEIKQETKKGLITLDEGKISLNHREIIFIGKTFNKTFDIRNLYSLPYEAGVNFELSDNSQIYKFYLKNGKQAVKWCLFIEELYKKR